jgi:hypothetical protein
MVNMTHSTDVQMRLVPLELCLSHDCGVFLFVVV